MADVVHWIKQAWTEVTVSSIRNCFLKAGFKMPETLNFSENEQSDSYDSILGDILPDSDEQNDYVTFDNLESVVEPEDDDDASIIKNFRHN